MFDCCFELKNTGHRVVRRHHALLGERREEKRSGVVRTREMVRKSDGINKNAEDDTGT